MLRLDRGRLKAPLTKCIFLDAIGAGCDAATASVIADAVHIHVIDHPGVVRVVNIDHVHVIDGTVVIEPIVAPVSAGISNTGVAESIINSTIKSDMRTPITGVP